MNELIIRKKIFLRNLFASFILFFSWFLFLSFLLCMFFSIGGYYSDSISTLFLLIYFPMTQVKEILHFIFATLAIYSLPTLIGIVKLTTNKEKKINRMKYIYFTIIYLIVSTCIKKKFIGSKEKNFLLYVIT